jgi:hypothetical protein
MFMNRNYGNRGEYCIIIVRTDAGATVKDHKFVNPEIAAVLFSSLGSYLILFKSKK